jgi:hypothetical protein
MEERKGTSSKHSEPVFNAAPVHASAGILQWPSNSGVAPLGIQTRPGNDYYVKLVDMAGER